MGRKLSKVTALKCPYCEVEIPKWTIHGGRPAPAFVMLHKHVCEKHEDETGIKAYQWDQAITDAEESMNRGTYIDPARVPHNPWDIAMDVMDRRSKILDSIELTRLALPRLSEAMTPVGGE